MDGMACGVDGDIGGDQAVVADHYFAHVDDGAVVVDEGVFADLDIVAVVTVKGRIDEGVVRLAKEFLDDGCDALIVRTVHGVELLREAAGSFLLIHYGRI